MQESIIGIYTLVQSIEAKDKVYNLTLFYLNEYNNIIIAMHNE